MGKNVDESISDQAFDQLFLIRKDVSQIIPQRETDFLQLGSQVHELATEVQQLVAKTQELIDASSGDTIEKTTSKLLQKLEVMRALCTGHGEQDGIAVITQIRNVLGMLLSLIGNYSRIVRTLQMLGISTRIESARLGSDGKGFTTLADDVEKLAHKIVEYSSSIREHASRLDSLAEDAHLRMQSMHAAQEQGGNLMVSSSEEHTLLLKEQADQAHDISTRVSDSMQRIALQFGEIVASMQFHDIVRQQVEHVEDTLQEAALLGKEEGSQNQDISGWLRDVCNLQAMQLKAGRESFSQAVSMLRTNLLSIAEDVQGVVVWAGFENTDEESVLNKLGVRIEELADFVSDLATQGEDMGKVMVSVAGTVTEMSAFLEDIEDVGDEIELIALNASIKAAHTGDKGRALGVLATSIQRLSQDAGEQTESISSALEQVSKNAQNLRELAQGYLDTTQADSVISELGSIMQDLRLASGQATLLLQDLRQQSSSVAKELHHTADCIVFDVEVSEALRQAEDKLTAFAGEIGAFVSPHTSYNMPDRVQAMLERYTMENERSVHYTALGGESANAESPDVELFDDEFDDNIELF